MKKKACDCIVKNITLAITWTMDLGVVTEWKPSQVGDRCNLSGGG